MNIKNKSTIPGASLASTIKVLAGLGPLGEKVLKQSGISKIDPQKNYPSEIRLKIFDEVYERFGEEVQIERTKRLSKSQNILTKKQIRNKDKRY